MLTLEADCKLAQHSVAWTTSISQNWCSSSIQALCFTDCRPASTSISQLQQQAEQEQAEQPAGSAAAKLKVDADKDKWSAHLSAACRTLGQEHVTNLAAAKDELARALMYLRSAEHTLRGLKRQTQAVGTGMPVP